ncbi:GNAT family N-acetyltransferase [Endozoicomonas sp. Mp262]|uniref:GNAT family N-acetyltransferase n=1 Tax=Endozoicomonas sp. Mp262 TaxID=2919499 RepID=UPI0021DAFACC
MRNQERYKELCGRESSIPIFSQAWWLDAVAEKQWDVVIISKNGQIEATLPYTLRKKYGFNILSQPQLTQNLGPWIRSTNIKYTKQLAREKALMNALICQLPDYASFSQNWSPNITNWLPFYWKGFEQTTRYTYRLKNIDELDLIWQSFRENIRRDIRKAEKREGLIVRSDACVTDFLKLNEKVFLRQGKSLPYTRAFVERIDKAASQKQARKIFIAEDSQGRQHAGVYIIWDSNSAYYLMGGGDPELRNSGATSLCMWEAIKYSSKVTECFDFEGSMIEEVERFFRAFGATQTPYNHVSHTPSRLAKTLKFIRSIKG